MASCDFADHFLEPQASLAEGQVPVGFRSTGRRIAASADDGVHAVFDLHQLSEHHPDLGEYVLDLAFRAFKLAKLIPVVQVVEVRRFVPVKQRAQPQADGTIGRSHGRNLRAPPRARSALKVGPPPGRRTRGGS